MLKVKIALCAYLSKISFLLFKVDFSIEIPKNSMQYLKMDKTLQILQIFFGKLKNFEEKNNTKFQIVSETLP